MNHETIISNIDNIIADLEKVKKDIDELPIECRVIEKGKKGRFQYTSTTSSSVPRYTMKKGGKNRKNKQTKYKKNKK